VIVELRQYALHPGARERLIDLFEREFVESQEAAGMTLIGQFRDLDDPDRFVWLRGFPDMESRRRSLEAFYDGPVWMAHRAAANATMISSDDVLLLEPADPASDFVPGNRRPRGVSGPGAGRIIGGVHALGAPEDRLPNRFRDETAVALRNAGAASVTTLVSRNGANTYPRLAVREGERVLVWFAAFADPRAADAVHPVLPGRLVQPLRLEPTARSRLHG